MYQKTKPVLLQEFTQTDLTEDAIAFEFPCHAIKVMTRSSSDITCTVKQTDGSSISFVISPQDSEGLEWFEEFKEVSFSADALFKARVYQATVENQYVV